MGLPFWFQYLILVLISYICIKVLIFVFYTSILSLSKCAQNCLINRPIFSLGGITCCPFAGWHNSFNMQETQILIAAQYKTVEENRLPKLAVVYCL